MGQLSHWVNSRIGSTVVRGKRRPGQLSQGQLSPGKLSSGSTVAPYPHWSDRMSYCLHNCLKHQNYENARRYSSLTEPGGRPRVAPGRSGAGDAVRELRPPLTAQSPPASSPRSCPPPQSQGSTGRLKEGLEIGFQFY